MFFYFISRPGGSARLLVAALDADARRDAQNIALLWRRRRRRRRRRRTGEQTGECSGSQCAQSVQTRPTLPRQSPTAAAAAAAAAAVMTVVVVMATRGVSVGVAF